jgi:hypothetical protein
MAVFFEVEKAAKHCLLMVSLWNWFTISLTDYVLLPFEQTTPREQSGDKHEKMT